MTRPIKFRYWNGQEMKEADTINSVVRDSGCEAWDGDVHDYFTLMQFTGLLDKNGKEIYEGDIVKYKRYITRWYEEESIIIFDEKKLMYRAQFAPDKLLKNLKSLEIIGNIHENPELINK